MPSPAGTRKIQGTGNAKGNLRNIGGFAERRHVLNFDLFVQGEQGKDRANAGLGRR